MVELSARGDLTPKTLNKARAKVASIVKGQQLFLEPRTCSSHVKEKDPCHRFLTVASCAACPTDDVFFSFEQLIARKTHNHGHRLPN